MLGAVCVATAQPYGENGYPHQNTQLSSGGITTINSPGFLMGGFRATSTSTDDNFYIDKTDAGGLFTTGTSFSRRYALRQLNATGSACTPGSLTFVGNCAGITTIETFIAGGGGGTGAAAYAVAGAYDRGVFFSTLSSTGVPLGPVLYYFPVTTTRVTKALIAEAPGLSPPSGSMYYYICGSYEDNAGTTSTYVLVVDQNGSLIFQDVFDGGAVSTLFEARAILPSPYNAGNLAVVGVVNDGINMATNKGFFMEVTPGTGLPPAIIFGYGQNATVGTDEFNSIAEAVGLGYTIGGYSDVLGAGSGNDWFIQIAVTGSVIWNSIFTPGSPDNINGVMGVTECVNTSGTKVYYGVAHSPTKGIVAMKLDASGNAFQGTGLTDFNTFEYTLTNLISGPTAITSNMSGSADLGIHIYGTGSAYSPSINYFVEAYLNGEEACSPSRDDLGTTAAGPAIIYSFIAPNNTSPFGNPCSNFLMLDNVVSPALINTICSSGGMGSGSNARPAQVTGLGENSDREVSLELFPNPNNGKTALHYWSQGASESQFRLYNSLGQVVNLFTAEGLGEHRIDIDLTSLEAGIYFLKGEVEGTPVSQKLVYTKD